MAIIDSSLEFADAVSVAAAAGTANIGNVVDISIARHVGRGHPVYLGITVDTGIITGGSAGTIQFRLVADTTATVSTSAPAEVLAVSPVFATGSTATTLAAGSVLWSTALPVADGQAAARFMAVQAITGTTTTTAGKINAVLTLDPIAPWEAVPVANY